MARRKLYARGFAKNRGMSDGRHGLVTCPRFARQARIGSGQWMCNACVDKDRAARLERNRAAHGPEVHGRGGGGRYSRRLLVSAVPRLEVAEFYRLTHRLRQQEALCQN